MNQETFKLFIVLGLITVIILSFIIFFLVVRDMRKTKPSLISEKTYSLSLAITVLVNVISILGIVAII